MDVQALSALLAALLVLAIGTSVVPRSCQDRIYTSFAAFTFTVGVRHLFTFTDAATASPVMHWLSLWATAMIPPTAIRFSRIFLAQPSLGEEVRRRGHRLRADGTPRIIAAGRQDRGVATWIAML